MRRRPRGRRNGRAIMVAIAFCGALLCLTFFSFQLLLVVLAVILIVLGLWLLCSC